MYMDWRSNQKSPTSVENSAIENKVCDKKSIVTILTTTGHKKKSLEESDEE